MSYSFATGQKMLDRGLQPVIVVVAKSSEDFDTTDVKNQTWI